MHHVLRGGIRHAAFGTTPAVNVNVRLNTLAWSNLDDAVYMDLSYDMNGDLLVNGMDVDIIVKNILATDYRDINLDGVVENADRDIIAAHIASSVYPMSFAQGDISGDGYVTIYDLQLYDSMAVDFNRDGQVDSLDLAILAANWLRSTGNAADVDGNGIVALEDFARLAQSWQFGN